MPDFKQVLRDFVATSNSGKYADEATLISKFPELKGYDIQVLRDFVATSNSGKYKTEDEVFSKFPEFNLGAKETTAPAPVPSQESVTPMVKAPAPKKKSEFITELPSVGGGLEQQGSKQPAPPSALKGPQKQVPMASDVSFMPKPFAPEYMQREVSKESKIAKSPYLKDRLSIINEELINKTEEAVVPEMQYQFGDLGFKFEKSGRTGDWMTVTAPNGDKKEFGLDPFFGMGAKEKADELRRWMNMRIEAIPQPKIKAIEETYTDGIKKYKNQKEVENDNKILSQQAESLQKELKQFIVEKESLDAEEAELAKTPAELRNSQAFIDKDADIRRRRAELAGKSSILETKVSDVEMKDKKLKENVAKYTAMKGEQGGWFGGIFNNLLIGVGEMASGFYRKFTNTAINLTPESAEVSLPDAQVFIVNKAKELGYTVPDLEKNIQQLKAEEDKLKTMPYKTAKDTEARQKQLEKINLLKKGFNDWYYSLPENEREKLLAEEKDDRKKRVFYGEEGQPGMLQQLRETTREVLGDKSTTLEWSNLKEQDFWGGALLGVAKSLPAILASKGRGAWAQRTSNMYAQGTDAVFKEMEQDPDFNNVSENEKTLIAAPIGIASSVLEEYGLRNVIGSKGVLNSLVLKALGKSGKNVTAKSFAQFIREDVESMLARGVLTLGAAGLAEFETGVAQQISETTIKQVYNTIKDKKSSDGEFMKMFNTPESIGEWAIDVVKAGAQEAIGGFVLGVPSAVSQAYNANGFKAMDDDTFLAFEAMANDGNLQTAFIVDLKNKINRGEVTVEEAKSTLNNYRNSAGLFRSIPEGLTTQQKKEAMNLLKEKRDLEQYVQDKDPALVTRQKNRINEINETLTKISEQQEVAPATVVTETPEATQQRVDRIAELEDLLNPDSPSLFPIEREEELRTELQTLKTEQDAIQKQAAGQVPVQPTAGVSETLAEGEPQAEPQVVTQEGVQEEVVLNTINPTGTIFSEYKPEQIDALPLGENITTYDVTANLNPTEKITIYRGVPNDVNEIKSGDFVTTNKQLAQDYAGTGKVISMEVNANEILDDKTEPLGEEYILRIPQPEVSLKTQEEAAPVVEAAIAPVVEPVIEQVVEPEEEFITIEAKDVKIPAFSKYNASDYVEDEREGDNGRSYTYMSSITVEATNADGDNIGSITKIVDEDGTLSFTAEDVEGNEVGRGTIYDTLAEAKAALAAADNKIRKKEFTKEQKAKAKAKEKAAAKAEKEKAKQKAKAVPAPVPAPAAEAEVEVEEVQGALDEMLDLDPAERSTGKKIVDGLDKLIKDIENFEKGTLGVNIALPIMKTILKGIKALVQAGMTLQEAIKKAANDNNVSVRDVTNGINAISQILPIQAEYDALMAKADALITRQKSRGIDDNKIVSNLDTMIRNSEVYKNANDAQRKIMEREARVKMGVGPRKAASIGRVIGVLKDITNVSRAEKLQIISRIRELSRDVAKDLAAEIRDLAGEGKITANQAANIISKFGKVNMLSEISVSKFVDYMTKVFADAEYASKLSKANSTKKSLSSLSKNKDKNANLRDLAQQFVKIDPSMVEDIDAYNEMASKILESIKGSTIRGQKVSFAEIVNIENATDYINDTLKAQQEAMLAERAAEIQSLMGIDVSDFSYDDMMMLLDSKKPISKYNEGIIRDTINRAFKVFSSIIKDAIRTGKDPFTGEDISFTESQKDVVERFMNMDLNILKPKDALEAVDALANFLQNKSTAKMEAVVSKYTGIQNAVQVEKKGIVASPLKKYFSKTIGRILGEQTTNLNILFERMFKGFNRGGFVMDKMGLTKLINKKSFAEKQANNIVDAYVNKFYKLKANGEAFNSAYNNIERGMVAFMMRNVVGTEQEMQAEFNRRKNLIKESIDVLSNGNDKEKAKAKLYQQAYDVIVKDSENIESIKKNIDKVNLEAVDFWMNEWSNKFEQLSDVSENVYNKILDKDINYTPDRFYKLSSDTGTVDIGDDDSAFLANSGIGNLYQRSTGVLMTAIRPESLPVNEESGDVNRYIDLSFDNNNSNSMYDALVDINTAAPIRQIQAFLNSSEYKKIVPTSEDAKILKDRIQLYVRNIRDKNPYSNDELSSVVRKLNKLAAIGVGQALGGVTQPIKQVIPVAINTIINGGGLDVTAVFNQAKNDFINNSGYAIASRGLASQAQIESLNKLIEDVSETKGEKLMAGIENLNKWWLDKFLIKPDVFIARASWLTYYEQSLKKQGIDTKDIDYSTHKLNEDAANYAQRMVDRQQNVSDTDLAGKLFANRESANQLLVKTLMPFASFRMNQSSRLGADLATLTNKTSTKEDKKIALRSVAGFAAEVATFRVVSIGISVLLGTLAKEIMGVDEDDEEKEKRVDNIIKGAKTGVFTDVFSPLPIADKLIQKGGSMITQSIEDATELPVAIYSPRKEEFLTNAGLFGIALERAGQLRELSSLSVTGMYTDDFGKEREISEDSQEGLSFLIPAAILSNIGLAPSEVNSVIRYAIKDSKKKVKTKEEVEKKEERKEEKELLEGYENKSDLKRYNPRLYEKNFGKNSEWYKSTKEERERKEKERELERKEKDRMYNYRPKRKEED